MKLKEALEILTFNTGNVDDITNKAINPLFDNKALISQLQISLNKYANKTKAIEDVYSFTLNTNTPYVPLPPLALRSEGFRAVECTIRSIKFPADIQGFNNATANFPYSGIAGIPIWLVPWGLPGEEYFYIYPMKSTDSATTSLTAAIKADDTTIPVTSTANFIGNNGRITIGSEKILYSSKDTTHFYGCRRGQEMTVASDHSSAVVVSENSMVIFYRRRHRDIVIYNNNIPQDELNRELEICNEHIDVVLDYTSYKLLSKVDVERAKNFKVNFDEWLQEAEWDIRKGRAAIKQGANIRDPLRNESGYSGAYTYL